MVYTIMNHTMKSGETVYGIITSGYKMDYKANTELLMAINNKDNLGAFKVGEILHVAVKSYIQNTAASAAPNAGVTATVTAPTATIPKPVAPTYSTGGITVVR